VRPGPVGRAVRGGLTRRRIQLVVIGLVLMVSTGASILALALVADSNAPFDHAFASQHGADVTASFSSAKASRAELAATGRLPEVTATAGPFAETATTLQVDLQAGSGPPGAGPSGAGKLTLPQLTLVGRASPGGPVDDVVLQQGHWPTRPGQIVLDNNPQDGNLPPGIALGTQAVATGVPGKPRLTVVGIASSVTNTADGWVVPAEIARLTAAGSQPGTQMLYQFSSAGSDAAIRADVADVARALPPGAVTATQSYLSTKIQEQTGIAPFAPFVVAFSIIGLVMSVLIVINVITGAVVAGYRRIGVLKSIGFTPGQVMTAYAAQALIPAVAGALAGVVLGNLLSGFLLSRAANVYQVGTLGVPAWVNLGVPVAMVVVVGIAALIPAARAGRLSAIQAMAAGRAPRQGGGYAAHRILGRLRLPRPVTIGLAAPFARPARTAVTLISVVLGAAAVTFGVGLGASFERVATGLSLSDTNQVQVDLPPPPGSGVPGITVRVAGPGRHAGRGRPAGPASTSGNGGPGPVRLASLPSAATAQRAVTAALRSQPGTLRYVAESDQQVSVAGLSQQVQVTAYQGSPAWLGYDMISGRWYSGPGQVDVPTYFLTVTGKTVGDTVTFSYDGRQVTARIVGEVFANQNNGLAMITSTQTLTDGGRTSAPPNQYDIQLRPGTGTAAYVQSLESTLGLAYGVDQSRAGQGLPIILGLISLLTLLLATVAGLGVLNTVVLQTREKVHDLGIFKAVGMTPRQTIAMVVCWVAGVGLIAGLIAVPAGIALQHYLVPVMGAAAGTAIPAVVLNVYGAATIAVLALAGAAIAIVGAMAPAGWAARARTEAALRAE
jgi:putative ABC transport system permease protein